MFKGHTVRTIKILKTEGDFIYLANPRGCRVHIKSKAIECLRKYGEKKWEPAGIYSTGKLGKAFFCDGEVNQVSRILATLFVPNPNGYKFVNFKDGNNQNVDIDNLQWEPSPNRQISSNCTDYKDRKALEGLKGKDYQNAYNNMIGSDGLNHAQRFRKRQKDLGHALLPRKISPTGKAVWIPKELIPIYRDDYNSGRVTVRECYDNWMEKIKNSELSNHRMKPRLTFEEFVKEYNDIH